MKKILFLIFGLTLSLSIFLPWQNTKAAEKIEYTLFHLETCPHCREEIKFLDEELMPKYGEFINLKKYEVSNQKNNEIFQQYGVYYNVEVGGVPMAFIDGEIVTGYASDKITGEQIMEIVEKKLEEKGLISLETEETKPANETIRLPVLGEINPANASLPAVTIILGLLDGFNPCAMWVLLFLISLLLGMEDKKKMWLLGSLFIVVSGLSYFVFMAAWLQFILFIGLVAGIRIAIGLLASGVGFINIKDWWQSRKSDGIVCKVSSNKDTRKTFEKIKDIVHRKNILWSVIGIILLAFSVNLVELACSAGFPAIFTQLLAINDIAMWQRYLYMFGYVLFFMLDDMIIFVIAMITLRVTGINTKYAKQINLFSGVLILILGLLLIFKPEWLMFA